MGTDCRHLAYIHKEKQTTYLHEVKAEQTESEWFKGLGVVRISRLFQSVLGQATDPRTAHHASTVNA